MDDSYKKKWLGHNSLYISLILFRFRTRFPELFGRCALLNSFNLSDCDRISTFYYREKKSITPQKRHNTIIKHRFMHFYVELRDATKTIFILHKKRSITTTLKIIASNRIIVVVCSECMISNHLYLMPMKESEKEFRMTNASRIFIFRSIFRVF